MSNEFVRSASTERGAQPNAAYVSTIGEDGVLHVVADCRGDEVMASRITQALNDRARHLRIIGQLLREVDGCRAGRPAEDAVTLEEARRLVG